MHHPKTIRRINDEAAERERKQAAVAAFWATENQSEAVDEAVLKVTEAVLKVADDFAPRLFEATPA
jgi:hypothetical protein